MLFNQVKLFSNNFFSLLSCGFRKEHSAQYAVRNLLPKWLTRLDVSDRIFGTLLMDLSKAYDCVNHDLIIAKLEAYSLALIQNSLTFIQNYLSQRQQRVKVGSSISEWLEIILKVPQGPILFNVFFNNL